LGNLNIQIGLHTSSTAYIEFKSGAKSMINGKYISERW